MAKRSHHRELTVAVCGVVVGAMMGAAAFIPSGQELTAKETRGTPVTRPPEIVRRALRDRNKISPSTPAATRKIAPPVSGQPKRTNCDAVVGYKTELVAYAKALWDGAKLDNFLDAAETWAKKFCEDDTLGAHAAAPETDKRSALKRKCDETYPMLSARNTTCHAYAEDGREYVPE